MHPLYRSAGLLSVMAAGLFMFASPSFADSLANGSFESSDSAFTGWNAIGNNSITNLANFGVPVPDGANYAFIDNAATADPNAAGGSVSLSSLNTFAGLGANDLNNLGTSLDPGTVTNLSGGDVVSGSAIQQTFTGHAGDVLSFQYKFVTSEDPGFGPAHDDFAFFNISNGTTNNLLAVSDVKSAFNSHTIDAGLDFTKGNNPYLGAYTYESSPTDPTFSLFSFTLASDGNYTFDVGAVNAGIDDIGSGLLADNFTLSTAVVNNPTPEPSGMSAFGVLLFVGGLFAIRRAYQAKRETLHS